MTHTLIAVVTFSDQFYDLCEVNCESALLLIADYIIFHDCIDFPADAEWRLLTVTVSKLMVTAHGDDTCGDCPFMGLSSERMGCAGIPIKGQLPVWQPREL